MWLSVLPLLRRRTGLVNHFFRVLVERLGPGELWMELRDGWGCKLATESDLPPLSLEETEYASARKRRRWDFIPELLCSRGTHSSEREDTACLGERVCDLWTLCKLYCTAERGTCPAMRISHNLTYLSHFLPHYLSLWEIADSQVFYMSQVFYVQVFIQVFLWKPDFHAKCWISQLLPTISLWIARKKISTKSRLLQETWQPPTHCQVP